MPSELEAVTEAIYDALANHHRINWSQAEVAARAALASASVPPGWVLVPKADMDALCDEAERNFEHGRDAAVGDCPICQAIIRYRAMIGETRGG